MLRLSLLAPSVVPAAVKQTATIIFLHGKGDCGQAWAEILPDFRPPHAKIICPNAPVQNVTLDGGIPMKAWFDLRPLDQPKDDAGIKMAAAAINDVIQSEVNAGIPSHRIVLGGFSQGGAVALYTALTSPFKLAGILALSTWLPLTKTIPWEKAQKHKILQCHGDEDEMIAIERAQMTADILTKHFPDSMTFKQYKGLNHTLNSEDEQLDIMNFLKESLPATQSKL